MQADIDVLPTSEVEKEGHPWQVPGPKPNLYVPPEQIEHNAPFPPVYPALHWQAVFVPLPAGEVE